MYQPGKQESCPEAAVGNYKAVFLLLSDSTPRPFSRFKVKLVFKGLAVRGQFCVRC